MKRSNNRTSSTSQPRAVVVVQLAEQSLPIPEDPGSNPVIATFIEHLFTVNCCRKDENKEKEAGNGPF